MLNIKYESLIEKFVQTEDISEAISEFEKYLIESGATIFSEKVKVFIGGDNRPSTGKILSLLSKGIQKQNGTVINFQLVTTPQLHYYGKYISQPSVSEQ